LQPVSETPQESPSRGVVALPAVAPTLGYLTEQGYRATGRVEVGGVILSLAGGVIAALIAAGIAMAWMLSPLPNWLILPMVAQGAAVGGVLAWLFKRYHFRSPAGGAAIGILCGLLSATAFHAGLYVRNVYAVRDELVADVEGRAKELGEATASQINGGIRAHPFRIFDQVVLLPAVRRGGFTGYMIHRGPRIWALALGQAALVTWLAMKLGRHSASRPFCEDCQQWYNLPYNAAVLPADLGGSLALAVESDDPSNVMELHRAALKFSPNLGNRCAIARLYTCPGCKKRLVDVLVRVYGRHAHDSPLLGLRRISPETATALKWEPSEPSSDAMGGGGDEIGTSPPPDVDQA
jgi:hypothetical protein